MVRARDEAELLGAGVAEAGEAPDLQPAVALPVHEPRAAVGEMRILVQLLEARAVLGALHRKHGDGGVVVRLHVAGRESARRAQGHDRAGGQQRVAHDPDAVGGTGAELLTGLGMFLL